MTTTFTPYEDAEIGAGVDLGSHRFTAEAIKAFARSYDPQPFHMDEAAARESHFGALCASGWHSAGVWMRLMALFLADARAAALAGGGEVFATGPSPGVEDLRWLRPVYAGDTIAYSTRIVGKRKLASRPGWGLLTLESRGVNQDGTDVLTFRSHMFVETRASRAESKGEDAS